MINFVSSDKNIAEIVIIDDEAYIKVNGTGYVEFEIMSAYNRDIKTSFSFNVI